MCYSWCNPLEVLEMTPYNHLLIIVEAWSGPIGPVDFLLLTLRMFSHVKCCVSCACDSYYSAAYLLVDVLLNGHHKMRD